MEIIQLPTFTFESGQVFHNIPAAYSFSSPQLSKTDNIILVLHAFSGDSEVSDWWRKFVGEGKLIDTNKHQVLCINTLAGCSGSFGPLSSNSETGEVLGEAFPMCTMNDLANFQLAVLDTLQITHIQTCFAISMGGVVGMNMLLKRPTFCDVYCQVAAPPQIPFEFHALNHLMKAAILADSSEGKRTGMGIARSLGMIFFQTNELNHQRFGDKPETYVDYLEKQQAEFHERFNWVTYVRLLEALETSHFDFTNPKLAEITTKMVMIAIKEDRAFPYADMENVYAQLSKQIANIDFYTISSIRGHDSFLLEPEKYQFFEKYITSNKGETYEN